MPNSTPSPSPAKVGKAKSSAGCGNMLGLVFVIILLLAAWNNISGHNTPKSSPTPQPTLPYQYTQPSGNVPSHIAPDAICHAYDAWRWEDPYYDTRCREAMQRQQEIFASGINEGSYNVYLGYYAEEEASEDNRANVANIICAETVSKTDPNYTYDCAQAQDREWRTGL